MPSPVQQTRLTLSRRFPEAFMGKGRQKKPLQVGIRQAVLEAAPDLDPQLVMAAIHDYTNGPRYLDNMVVGASRIDLAGNQAGVVSAAHAAWSAGHLVGLRKRWALRDAARRGKVTEGSKGREVTTSAA